MQEDSELQGQMDGSMKPGETNGMRCGYTAFRHGVLQNAERANRCGDDLPGFFGPIIT